MTLKNMATADKKITKLDMGQYTCNIRSMQIGSITVRFENVFTLAQFAFERSQYI